MSVRLMLTFPYDPDDAANFKSAVESALEKDPVLGSAEVDVEIMEDEG